jgi:hypothetical protein
LHQSNELAIKQASSEADRNTMGKPSLAWLVLVMLFLSACTSESHAISSPTIPPTRILSFATPGATPTASPIPSTTATVFRGLIPTQITPSAVPTEQNPFTDLSRMLSFMLNPSAPTSVNGLAYEEFILMPPNVIANIRRIYRRGQRLERDSQAFSRTGDSTIERPNFFYHFDEGEYHLGAYAYLQPTIDYYAGSFGHDSVAVRRGLHTWSVLDPMWADGECESGEHMLDCEFRLHNPGIFFIRLGSNDSGAADLTEESFRAIIEYCIDAGVIPVLGTKADRFEGSNATNELIRALAEEYELPLWDFDLVASTLENRGLGNDGVHLTTFPANDWRLPEGFSSGHGLHNLTGLIMLNAIWQVLNEP